VRLAADFVAEDHVLRYVVRHHVHQAASVLHGLQAAEVLVHLALELDVGARHPEDVVSRGLADGEQQLVRVFSSGDTGRAPSASRTSSSPSVSA
jgi:hypothetical protein